MPKDTLSQPVDLVNICNIEPSYFAFVYYPAAILLCLRLWCHMCHVQALCRLFCPKGTLCQPTDLAKTCNIQQCYLIACIYYPAMLHCLCMMLCVSCVSPVSALMPKRPVSPSTSTKHVASSNAMLAWSIIQQRYFAFVYCAIRII